MRPFRLINQVESRERIIWNQFAVEGEREFRSGIPDRRRTGIVDTVEMTLDGECQTEGRTVPIQKSVAQIDGSTLPSQLPEILKAWNTMNVVHGKSATHFDPEIFDGHQLQLEFLTDGR